MKQFLYILICITAVLQSNAQQGHSIGKLPVNLKGEESATIITNNTDSVLNIQGTVFFNLPVSEKEVNVIIPPKSSDTLRIKMNHADFIQFTPMPFKIYNAPGKIVKCVVQSINPLKLNFTGDLHEENDYYQAYFQQARSNQVYYKAGDRIKNFNKFPHVADSINRFNLDLLENYKGALSPEFRKHEYWRIMYNNAFLKHHVLFDKEFKSGQKIIRDPDYYQFDGTIPLVNSDAALSAEYLWYAIFRLRDNAVKQNKADSLLSAIMLADVQSLYGNDEMGDVLRMRILYDTYANSKNKYDKLLRQISFVNPENKITMDSIAQARYSLPLVGQTAPDFHLINFSGDSISLSHFKGHNIIVNFWASWCTPCIREFPAENRLYDDFRINENLIVIDVCIESPVDAWKSLSLDHKLKVINIYANDKQTRHLKKSYNISALPKSILIDQDMKIINNNFKRASLVTSQDLTN